MVGHGHRRGRPEQLRQAGQSSRAGLRAVAGAVTVSIFNCGEFGAPAPEAKAMYS